MKYEVGRNKSYIRHHFYVLSTIALCVLVLLAGSIWQVSRHDQAADISQTQATIKHFDPNNTAHNIAIDMPLYTMELPSDWKQISINRDSRYDSTQWQMQSKGKNRWIEVYTDRMPLDMAFNRIIPVTISGPSISAEPESENCSRFTPKTSESNLKVISKWQNVEFLCDLSNANDNVVGISSKTDGTKLQIEGPTQGKHFYMFVYTDRGVPEDTVPITTALSSFTPK